MLLSEFLKDRCGKLVKGQEAAKRLSGTEKDVDVERFLADYIQAADEDYTRQLLAYGKGDVHQDKFMSNLSVSYRTPEVLIADAICPVVKVDFASDKYVVFERKDAVATTDDEVGPTGDPAEIEENLSSDSYVVVGRALSQKIANDIVANADDPIKPLQSAGINLRTRMARNREVRVATLLQTSGNYNANLRITKSGTAQWNDVSGSSTSNPIEDIFSLMAKVHAAAPFNGIAFSDEAWIHFRKHPKVCAAMGVAVTAGAQGPMATVESVKAFFGFEYVLIGNAKKNTANTGAVLSLARIWGKHVVLTHIAPGAERETLCHAKTFRHQQIAFEQWNDPKPGVSGVTWLKQSYSDVEKIVSTDCGGLIIDAIA